MYDLKDTQILYAFQLDSAKQAFKSFNNIDCTMVKKKGLHDFLVFGQDNSVDGLIRAIGLVDCNDSKIALVYEQASTLSIELI